MSRLILRKATTQVLRLCPIGLLSLLVLFICPSYAHMEEGGAEFPNRGMKEELARGELDFRLPSAEIRAFALSEFQDFKSVLLIAVDSQACANLEFEKKIISIQKSLLKSKSKTKKKPMQIIFLDVALAAEREKIESRLKDTSVVYLFDHLQTVSRSFQLSKANDFVLIDPSTIEIKTRGNLSSTESMAEAATVLKEFSQEFSTSWSKFLTSKKPAPPGEANVCDLAYVPVKTDDFKEDFLRPFARACLGCHVASQVHDHFTTLDQVLGWRMMSLRTIRLLRMPGRYDPYYYPYRSRNEKSDPFIEASNEDMRKVVAWLSKPPSLTEEMRKQFLSTRTSYVRPIDKAVSPDPVALTVELEKKVSVPAEGPPVYINSFVGEPLKEDIVVQGLFLRTNLNVVHHTTIFAFDPKTVDSEEFAKSVNMGYQHRRRVLAKYYGESAIREIPGTFNGKKRTFTQVFEPLIATFSRRQGIMTFPSDSAMLIRKGMQLAIQLHMEPSGKPEEATLSFDLLARSSKQPFSTLRRVSIEPEKSFRIQPGQKSYIVRSRSKFDRPILLKAISFHTHYRGIAARIRVERKSGVVETIASLPFMQMKSDRRLSIPYGGLWIDAGETFISEVEYDNSERNMANPDPKVMVELGGRTLEDEMHYPRYLYLER